MSNSPVVITVGGGKGGTGKSTLSAGIGSVLAGRGTRVVLVDADIGGANLHTMLGLQRPRIGLGDFLSGHISINDATVATSQSNLRLLSGASDMLELAGPGYAQKQKIMSGLAGLDADCIIIDLGAGSGPVSAEFFAAFKAGVVVLDGLQTSVENAYSFLKNSVIRGLARQFPAGHRFHNLLLKFADPLSPGGIAAVKDLLMQAAKIEPASVQKARDWLASRRYSVVCNMVRDGSDVEGGRRFSDVVAKYLAIECVYAGYIVFDNAARDAIRSMKPFASIAGERTRICLETVADNIMTIAGAD